MENKRSLKESVSMTSARLLPIWGKARVPTKTPVHVVEHIRKLRQEWQGLKKLIKRTSNANLLRQQVFRDCLDDLFYIAHRDAVTLITIQEDKDFLKAKREKGRRGMMGGVDRRLALQEESVTPRTAAEQDRAV